MIFRVKLGEIDRVESFKRGAASHVSKEKICNNFNVSLIA